MRRPRRGYWTGLTAVGLAAGIVAGLAAGVPLGKLVNAMITTAAVTCVIGLVLGAFQAFALRSVLRQPVWWVIGTTVGLGVGLAAGVVTVEQLGTLLGGVRPNVARLSAGSRALSFVALGTIAGTILGVGQSLVLNAQAAQIRRWIATTAIGLALSLCSGSILLDIAQVRIGSPAGLAIFVLSSGLLFGLVTSGPLHRTA